MDTDPASTSTTSTGPFAIQKSADFMVPPALAARLAILALESDLRGSSGQALTAAAA
jgi:hypothetical protein